MLTDWQKSINGPMTFTLVAKQWAPTSRNYVRDVSTITDEFYNEFCNGDDPNPGLVQEARQDRQPKTTHSQGQAKAKADDRGRGRRRACRRRASAAAGRPEGCRDRQAAHRGRAQGETPRSRRSAPACSARSPRPPRPSPPHAQPPRKMLRPSTLLNAKPEAEQGRCRSRRSGEQSAGDQDRQQGQGEARNQGSSPRPSLSPTPRAPRCRPPPSAAPRRS